MAGKLKDFSAADRKAAQAQSKAWADFFRTDRTEAGSHAGSLDAHGEIAAVQAVHEAALLLRPNVVGVGPAFKVVRGKPTAKLSLTIFVEQKVPKSKLSKSDMIPAEIDGIRTDVVETGRIDALAFTAKKRPAVPAFSIGHHAITAGTFGCLVRDLRRRDGAAGDDYLILSNNHVLADVNKGKPGDAILQPSPFDQGEFPSDTIAVLDRFEPIVLSQFPPTGYNVVDAAVARPLSSRFVTASIIGRAMPAGIGQAQLGMAVIKLGRTTQLTAGHVLSVDATIAVGYGADGTGLFRHQIVTTAMAAGGDSGSLLMEATTIDAVGLLFAGSPFTTIFNHIADVEVALGVRPLTAARSS